MKIIKSIFITVLLLLCTALYSFADDEIIFSSIESDSYGVCNYIPDVSDNSELCSETIESVIYEGLLKASPEINISNFGYTLNDVNEIRAITDKLLYTNYEIYYFTGSVRYNYYTNSGMLINLYPEYTTTDKNEIAENRILIKNRIDEILAYAEDDATDVQKLLTVYDRLILESEYDEQLQKSTIKDILVDGTAVCMGYTMAMNAFAKELGIPCGYVRSEDMYHVWNAFYIDGEWYHADATYDDPTNDRYARTNHNFFLKSDEWMITVGKHNGFEKIGAVSTKYDEFFWNYIHSSIISVDEKMFYINGDSGNYNFYCYNTENDSYTKIFSFSDKWLIAPGSNSFWADPYYIGLCYNNGTFYFNTSTSIVSIDENGENINTLYNLPDGYNYSIYGCFGDGNIIRFGKGLKSAPETGMILTREFIEIPDPNEDENNTGEYITGDITGDENVDMNDAIYLLQYSLFPDLYPLTYKGSVDFTGDGNVDMNDAILLLQYSLFPDLYPID